MERKDFETMETVLTADVKKTLGGLAEKHIDDWAKGHTHDFILSTNRCARPIFRAVEEMLERSLDPNDMCEVQDYFVDRACDYYEGRAC